jgi:hypothetical protein
MDSAFQLDKMWWALNGSIPARIMCAVLLIGTAATPATATSGNIEQDAAFTPNLAIPHTKQPSRYAGRMVLQTREDVVAVLASIPALGLVEVGKGLVIRGNELTEADLAPLLSRVVRVRGSISITGTRLTSLPFLSQLAAVHGPVEISGNTQLSSACGLSGLATRAVVGSCVGDGAYGRSIEQGFSIFMNGPLVLVPQHLASGRGIRDRAVTPVDCSAGVDADDAATEHGSSFTSPLPLGAIEGESGMESSQRLQRADHATDQVRAPAGPSPSSCHDHLLT